MTTQEMKEKFEEAVKAGTTNWTVKEWDSIGVPGKREYKTWLDEYPRYADQGSSDVVHIVVNGVQVKLHGTSNMNEEEHKQYYDRKGKGSGTSRSSVPSNTSAEREKYYNDLAALLESHPEITEISALLDDLASPTFHAERYYFKGYKKVSKDWLCFTAEDGSKFENPEGHVQDFLAEGRGFAPAISADKLPKILELAKENGVEIC